MVLAGGYQTQTQVQKNLGFLLKTHIENSRLPTFKTIISLLLSAFGGKAEVGYHRGSGWQGRELCLICLNFV